MSLLAEEEDEDDSAFESESETQPNLKRQISRQFSRQDSLTVGRPRSSSHRFSHMTESTMSVTSATTELSIYVSLGDKFSFPLNQ